MKFVFNTISRIGEDEVPLFAAQASFYTIIASIPFLMLLLAVLKFFVPFTETEVMRALGAFLPSALDDTVETVVSELFSKQSGTIIPITLLTSFWSASRGVASIERGVRRVYMAPSRKNPIAEVFFSMLYTVLFLAVLLFCLGVMVFGNFIYDYLSIHLVRNMLDWVLWNRLLIFILMSVIFAFLYTVFANFKIPYKNQLPGACFSTLCWAGFSFVFSIYINNFANYSYVYGSLAAVVLMMIWLYSCLIILLLGAELNNFIYLGREEFFKGKDR